MELLDLIANVDKSETNEEWVDHEKLATACDLPYVYDMNCGAVQKELNLKEYWLVKRYCTDQFVGVIVGFVGDTPAYITKQSARKADRWFYFVDVDIAEHIRDTYHRHTDSEEFKLITDDGFDVSDLTYVSYASQVCKGSFVTYGGERHIVTDRTDGGMIVAEDMTGLIKCFGVKECTLEYNLAEDVQPKEPETNKESEILEYFKDPSCTGKTANAINNAGWDFDEILRNMDIQSPPKLFNNVKPILCSVIKAYYEDVLKEVSKNDN